MRLDTRGIRMTDPEWGSSSAVTGPAPGFRQAAFRTSIAAHRSCKPG